MENSEPLAASTTDWRRARCPACEGTNLRFEQDQMVCYGEDCGSASPSIEPRMPVNETMTGYMDRMMLEWTKKVMAERVEGLEA